MTAKHTPGPWKVTKLSHADDQLWLQITGPDGRGPIVRINSPGEPMPDGVIAESKYLVTPEENQIANAEFIVLACNSHDALLDVCEAMLDRLKTNNGGLELGPIQQRGWAKLFQSAISQAGESGE